MATPQLPRSGNPRNVQPVETRARNVFLAALVVFVAMAAVFTLGIVVDLRVGNNIFAINNAIPLPLMFASLAGMWLSRRGRYEWAVIQLNIAIVVTLLFSITIVSGVGFVIGVAAPIVVIALSGIALPPRMATRMILLGVGGGVATILLDLFWPFPRAGSGIGDALPFILLGLVLFLGVVVWRQFSRYSLRTKLIIGFVGIAALSVGAISFIVNSVVTSELTRSVGADLKQTAATKALTIGGLMSKHIELLQSFGLSKVVQDRVVEVNATYTGDSASIQAAIKRLDEQWRAADKANNDADPLVHKVLNEEIASELSEFRDTFPDHVEVFVTDKYGANVAATNRTSDYYQADEGWWQAAYNNGQGSVYIGQPEFDESSQTYSTNIAVPLYAHDTQAVAGVLRTTLDLKVVSAALGAGNIELIVGFDLLLPSNEILHSEESEAVDAHGHAEGEEIDLNALNQLRATNADYLAIDYQGVPRLLGKANVLSGEADEDVAIAPLNWLIVAHQNQADALQPVEAGTQATVLTSLGVLLLTVLLALLVAQRLTDPIVRLTATAAKVSGGDLTAQAPVDTNDEIGALATTFNVMTTQLRETLESLEQRVADRTRALAASADVSRRLSTVLDQPTLVREVVEQVQSAFDYYHAHIYFWDEGREYLVMAGGTGEAGETLLARGHKIHKGKGLVGRAAETQQAVLVPDTSKEPGWLPNPLLPDTRAEIAVPIMLGDRVLGVLDVQHNIINDLDHGDVELLQSIANQVAIAAQNARAYAQAQRQADFEVLVNTIGQKIQDTLTVESALQVAVREVGRALGGARTRVKLSQSASPNGQE